MQLRAIRQQCGLSFREVYAASQDIAKEHRQPAFVISPSRLHAIETKNVIPGIHRLYALARVYGRTLNEILSLYGIPLGWRNGSPRQLHDSIKIKDTAKPRSWSIVLLSGRDGENELNGTFFASRLGVAAHCTSGDPFANVGCFCTILPSSSFLVLSATFQFCYPFQQLFHYGAVWQASRGKHGSGLLGS
jgi:transcriptional regulator with XRE-family HTH domain